METELQSTYDSRASFYGKAIIITTGNYTQLKSYNTIVAEYNSELGEVKVNGWYSATTARHINEFLQQLGFDKMTKAEMEE